MPTQGNRCTVHAPAKLNLCLELLGKRNDGLHELRTVMATVGWHDALRISSPPSSDSDLRLRVLGAPGAVSGVPEDGSNLILRALERLKQAAGEPRGASVELVKRVPNQAGLGGGSSDAAAALIAGNRVWNLGWSLNRLGDLAAQLGSDLPFFVHAIGNPRRRFAVATGRGEEIHPFRAKGTLPVVIVKPSKGLATGQVYGACLPDDYAVAGDMNKTSETRASLEAGDRPRLVRSMVNGLQAAATRLAPWLADLAERFRSCGFHAHQLSGSGSAYFGLIPSMREAIQVAARLRALRVGQVYATTIG